MKSTVLMRANETALFDQEQMKSISKNFLTSNFPQQRALKTRALKKQVQFFQKKQKHIYPKEQEQLNEILPTRARAFIS